MAKLPPPTPEFVHLWLSMVDCEHIDMATVLTWTPKQLLEAEKWALKSHLKASDNIVRIPPRPAHVTKKAAS